MYAPSPHNTCRREHTMNRQVRGDIQQYIRKIRNKSSNPQRVGSSIFSSRWPMREPRQTERHEKAIIPKSQRNATNSLSTREHSSSAIYPFLENHHALCSFRYEPCHKDEQAGSRSKFDYRLADGPQQATKKHDQ